jgi:hypothetical protein
VEGAEAYAIYRAAGDSSFRLLAATSASQYLDGNVLPELDYHYTIATIDSQASPVVGPGTHQRSARPSAPPRVAQAWFLPPYHVSVQFNEGMSESIRCTDAYRLHKTDPPGEVKQPESIVIGRSGSEAILAFSGFEFASGEFQLAVAGVEDADGVPLDTAAAIARFVLAPEELRFYLRSAQLESPQSILLRFNLPVDKNSAGRAENYTISVEPQLPVPITIDEALLSAQEAPAVHLRLHHGLIAPLGRSFLVTARGVRSAAGIALQPGEGDAVGFAAASQNLKQVMIYPNPFIAARHGLLTIAGLPAQATIRVLDESGRVLVTLHENDGNGGANWDTRDRDGRLLPSGTYVFYITAGGETAWAKGVIIR